MNVLWVFMDAISIVPTPMEAMCAVATLDTKSLPTTEHVWVRRYTVCVHNNNPLSINGIVSVKRDLVHIIKLL